MGAMVAALYVQAGGCYFGLPNVDPWDEQRDARLYDGPWPVVAHPPCSRWCRLAGLVEARWGHKRGEDDGCFEAALASVRKWGGVLEHPAYSDAWGAFGLNRPPSSGGWVVADFEGGWTCHVEQGWLGHKAPKPTWLYAIGVDVPSLPWGEKPWVARCKRCGAKATENSYCLGCLGSGRRHLTPIEFRDVLLDIARGATDGRR